MIRITLILGLLISTITSAQAASKQEIDEFMLIARAHAGRPSGNFSFSVETDEGPVIEVRFDEKKNLLLIAPLMQLPAPKKGDKLVIQFGYVDAGLTGKVTQVRLLHTPVRVKYAVRNKPTKDDQKSYDTFLRSVITALTRRA